MRIEIWSDVVCPWCYIGKRRLERALAGFPHADEVEVVYRSFELDPSAPRHEHGGARQPTTPVLAEKYGQSEAQMRRMQEQLIATAAEEGLAFRLLDTVHTNTVDAHRLLHLALATGGPALQLALKETMLAAYFSRAEDVGDPAVLRRLATEVGLDAERVEEVLGGDEFADEVEADVAQARAYGAGGVPFHVIDGRYGVSGAQPTEVFAEVLDRAWADSHPTLQTVGGAADACGPDGCAI